MVDEALQQNLTLRQLWARLEQAKASAVQAASLLYPQLDLTADASYTRSVTTLETEAPSFRRQLRNSAVESVAGSLAGALSENLGGATNGSQAGNGVSRAGGSASFDFSSPPTRQVLETKQFGLGLAASYEIDLWGRISSSYKAASYDFQATRYDLESTAMTVASEVAILWLGILEQQELQAVLQEQLATNSTYLELVELRFRKALVSALDVYQQREAVGAVKKQIALVEAQEEVFRHELAVLLGKPPAARLVMGDYDLAELPPPPGTGIPADLLYYRPDIRASLSRLHAADYRVASARADRLPAIRLTGGIGYNADDIANIFDDWFINLAAGLVQPLFDGYQREAEVERTLAVVEERLADYRLTVLNAIKEVENALIQQKKQQEHIEALKQQLTAARNSLEQATQRYQKGLTDYLPVLTALERTQLLARDLVSARRELLVFRINLYRALGGSWTQELYPPEFLSDEKGMADAKNGSKDLEETEQ
jgi:NodT family efflux transporter outer membrane factor (OMF) lipoprotein